MSRVHPQGETHDDNETASLFSVTHLRKSSHLSRILPICSLIFFGSMMIAVVVLLAAIARPEKHATAETDPPPTEPRTPYDLLISDLIAHPSDFMTTYTNPKDDSSLYLELSSSFLSDSNSMLLISAIFSKGTFVDNSLDTLMHMPAETSDDLAFEFRLSAFNTSIDFIRPNLVIRSTDVQYQQLATDGAWPGWLLTLPIQAQKTVNGSTRYVVSASGLMAQGFFVCSYGQISSRIVKVKAFPRNILLTVEMQVIQNQLPHTFSVDFSIAVLPEVPMSPRRADERIGYFSTVWKDVGYHIGRNEPLRSVRVDPRVAVINRRRLSPENPLTYYIDPSVPKRWRAALKRGIQNWQEAFSLIGLNNVIRTVMPDDPEWPSDYDAGDIRYNTVSFAVSTDSTFAIGPSTVDPRSGEILNSDIVFTQGWIKVWMTSIEEMDVASAVKELMGNKDEHSHEHSHGHSHKHFESIQSKLRGDRKKSSKQFHHRHLRECQHSRMLDVSSGMAELISLTKGGLLSNQDILEAGLTDVMQHEVGHTLGLRHNFKGSTAVSWDNTANPNFIAQNGLTSSVMDYLPLNLRSDVSDALRPSLFTPKIGEYDKMAIKYGYLPLQNENVYDIHPTLQTILDNALPFATDEDHPREDGFDMDVSAWDVSDDPIEWYADRLDLVSNLRESLFNKTVARGESFTKFSNAELILLKQIRMAGMYLAKAVGGYRVSKNHRDSVTHQSTTAAPITVVDTRSQIRAFGLILSLLVDREGSKHIFADQSMFPFLVSQTGECSGIHQYCYGSAPMGILELVDQIRSDILSNLVNRDRLSRIRSSEWFQRTTGTEPFFLQNMFASITSTLFGSPLINSLTENSRNWNIQLKWIDLLESISRDPLNAKEVTVLATHQLFTLQQSVYEVSNSSSSPLVTFLTHRLESALKVTDNK